jgi:hypothetical protein
MAPPAAALLLIAWAQVTLHEGNAPAPEDIAYGALYLQARQIHRAESFTSRLDCRGVDFHGVLGPVDCVPDEDVQEVG